MIIDILHRLTTTDRYETYQTIMDTYGSQGYAIIHFVYFASLNRILQHDIHQTALTMQDQHYYDALMSGDMILPDGIALQLLYYTRAQRRLFSPTTSRKRLPNLNGTDFIPYILNQLHHQYSSRHRIRIILFGAYAQDIPKAKEYLTQLGGDVLYYQDGYNTFDRGALQKAQEARQSSDIRLLLVGRGSPRQEIWCQEHETQIKEHNLIVFTVGGLFDFWAGKERRAPRLIRAFKGERARRLLQHPRKNRTKFLSSFHIFPTLFTQKSIETR